MKKLVLVSVFLILMKSFVFSQNDYELVWSDEFDGTSLDLTKWDYQQGTGASEGLTGWGNNERQYYTEENVRLEDGMLIITAKKETKGGMPYTSSRILTRGKYTTTFGRIEARVSLPEGTGLWPAFWMLPDDSPYGTWASSGEIDIMEVRGRIPEAYSGAVHYGDIWPRNVYHTTGDYRFPDNGTIEGFHVYALEWTDSEIAWYCDDNLVGKFSGWYSANGQYPAPFDVPFYILLNMAVGGTFDGERVPGADFVSAEMKVDYVRVYKQVTGIKDIKASNITISKEDNVILVDSPNSIKGLKLYSISGDLVFAQPVSHINTSGLNKGMYLLEVNDVAGDSKTFKVRID